MNEATKQGGNQGTTIPNVETERGEHATITGDSAIWFANNTLVQAN